MKKYSEMIDFQVMHSKVKVEVQVKLRRLVYMMDQMYASA